jgi:uncharacterized oxidoreductase
MNIQHSQLKQLATRIFLAAGCHADEAARVGHYLTEANLVGHDSHGVIRIPSYIDFLNTGKVLANQNIQVVFENDVIAVVDGQFGLGQTIGEQATKLGIAKSAMQGVSVIALRNAGHLGRVGDWPLLAAHAGKLSLHFVNTSGGGILVAPFGGISRRLSADPIAVGVPRGTSPPILLDMSCCSIAEGKIRVALDKDVPVPSGCIIDAKGRPTTDPKVFYGEVGAILPMAGHKGYGLGVITEILAGALTGGGASNPENAGRIVNSMFSIYLDPSIFHNNQAFTAELDRFVEWIKSSEKSQLGGEILMPGEIEERTKAQRLRDGIELADTTWDKIAEVCRKLQVPIEA